MVMIVESFLILIRIKISVKQITFSNITSHTQYYQRTTTITTLIANIPIKTRRY